MILYLEDGTQYRCVRNEQNKLLFQLNYENHTWVTLAEVKHFSEVIDCLLECELGLKEFDTLNELKTEIKDLLNKVEDWFQQHADYLAQL